MSGGISNSKIYETLLQMSNDIGEIKAQSKSNGEAIASHAADDTRRFTAMFDRVNAVEKSQARQKGFMAGLTTVGGVVGAAAGYLVERFGMGGGNH